METELLDVRGPSARTPNDPFVGWLPSVHQERRRLSSHTPVATGGIRTGFPARKPPFPAASPGLLKTWAQGPFRTWGILHAGLSRRRRKGRVSRVPELDVRTSRIPLRGPRIAGRSGNGFAVSWLSDALNALVAVIGTAGQRAGRPSGDVSREVGRALLMFARVTAFRANFKKGARGR